MPKESILKEFENHKGEFVITDTDKVMRLLAVGEDEHDYYWVYWDGRETSWHSCVGRFVVLKGKIDKKDYNEFIRIAKLNHYDLMYLNTKNEKTKILNKIKVERMKQEFTSIKDPNNKYITELCWKIN